MDIGSADHLTNCLCVARIVLLALDVLSRRHQTYIRSPNPVIVVERPVVHEVLNQDVVALSNAVRPILGLGDARRCPVELREHHMLIRADWASQALLRPLSLRRLVVYRCSIP